MSWICRTHLSLFFCYFLTTVAHLLFDDIKHEADHFAPFLVFKILEFVDCFHIRKTYGEVWKRNKKPSWKFLPYGVDYALNETIRLSDYNVSSTVKHREVCLDVKV